MLTDAKLAHPCGVKALAFTSLSGAGKGSTGGEVRGHFCICKQKPWHSSSLTTSLYMVLHGIPNKSATSQIESEGEFKGTFEQMHNRPSKDWDAVRWGSTSNKGFGISLPESQGSGISLPESQVWSKTREQPPSLQPLKRTIQSCAKGLEVGESGATK